MTTDRNNSMPAPDPPHRRLFFSLKYKMLVYFGLLFTLSLVIIELVSLFGAPYTDYQGEFNYQQNEIFRNLNHVADAKKEYLLSLIKERRNNIMALAKSGMVRANGSELHGLFVVLTASGMQGRALRDAMRKDESFKMIVAQVNLLKNQYKMYEEIEIADLATGIVIASTEDDDIGENVFKKYAFMASRKDGNLSKISFDKMGNSFHLHLTEPILDIKMDVSDENQIRLILIAHVNSGSVIDPLLHTGRGLGKTGEVVMVDANTRIIAPLKYKLSNGLTAVPLKYRIKAKPAMMAARGEEGITASEDYRGEKVLAAYRHILILPDLAWGMVVKIDESEVFSPLYQRLEAVTITGAVGLMVTLLLAWFLSHRISVPLEALSRAVEKVEKGELNARVESAGFIETYTLASAFNSMIAKIHLRRIELEELVLKRTMQLQSINTDLVREIAERKKAEEERDRFFTLSIDLLCIAGADGFFKRVNKAFENTLGYTKEELLSKPFVEFMHPDDRDRTADEVEEQLKGKTTFSFENRYICKDGSTRYFLWTAFAVIDEGLIYAIAHDITQRKMVEEVLLESEGKYRGLFENANDSIFISDPDSRQFLNVNENAAKRLGYTKQELLRMKIDDLYSPEDKEIVAPNIKKLIEGQSMVFDTFHRRKDGSRVPIEISGRIIEYGDQRVIQSFVRDITERKRAEQAVRKSEENIRLLLESTVEGIYGVDLDGNCTFANPSCAKVIGYGDINQLVGNNMHALIHHTRNDGTPYPEEECRIYEAFREKKPTNVDDEILWRSDGTSFPAEYRSNPIWQDGNVIGTVVTFIDITERKKAEKELKKHRDHLEELVEERTNELSSVNKELEAFAYSVSHDLRAPLRGIDGFSRALLEDYSDKLDDTGKDYLNRVSAATLRMSQLIDDLLTLSRVTRSEMTTEPVDLSALAHDVADDLGKEEPTRHIKLSIDKGLMAQGDKRLLHVVLYNLMSNSWKFTWKRLDASIEIGSDRREEEEVYFVRDNGVGFDMKYADKLFGAFQRLHTLAEFPGTGIGLAIVQRIIHRHGGRVWAEAEVDKGAVFYFTL